MNWFEGRLLSCLFKNGGKVACKGPNSILVSIKPFGLFKKNVIILLNQSLRWLN